MGGDDYTRTSMTALNENAENFKLRDAASYTAVVQEFDHYTDRLTLPLALKLIALANMAPSDHVLDIGCGTGIVALQAARWGGHHGKALGIDLSEQMLATAAAKAAQAELQDRVSFKQMDAEHLELEDCSFDTALSLFALLHFPNPQIALAEMFRVLRPGGTLVVAVGSRPPFLSLDGLLYRASRLPDLLRMMRGLQLTAPAALNHMVERRFPGAGESEESHLAHHSLNRTRGVVELVRKAGFTILKTDWVGNQLTVDSPEEFWTMQRTFSSIARKRLDDAPQERVAAFREDFLRTCRAIQQRGGRLAYPTAAFYVSAQRPRA